jgi:hypothetical protein
MYLKEPLPAYTYSKVALRYLAQNTGHGIIINYCTKGFGKGGLRYPWRAAVGPSTFSDLDSQHFSDDSFSIHLKPYSYSM